MSYRKPHNHSLRHPPRVPAGRAPSPAPATAPHTPPGSARRPSRHPPHRGTRIPSAGPVGAASSGWSQVGRVLGGVAWIAVVVGSLLLAAGFVAPFRVSFLGLVLAVAG